MHFRMTHTAVGPTTKKGPDGAPLRSDREVGGLDAQARCGDCGEEAEEQQEARDDPIEVREGHDTHLGVLVFR